MCSLNFFKLCTILGDQHQCIQWCKEHNLLSSSIKCPRENCSNTLTWTLRTSLRDGYEWRCSRRKYNGLASMRQNSWFSGSRLSIEKVLALMYAWAHKFTTTQAVHETSLDDESTSTETVIDWYNYCVMSFLLFINFLFLISPWPYLCVFIYIIVRINIKTAGIIVRILLNSLDY